jgi:hypothetical protein
MRENFMHAQLQICRILRVRFRSHKSAYDQKTGLITYFLFDIMTNENL